MNVRDVIQDLLRYSMDAEVRVAALSVAAQEKAVSRGVGYTRKVENVVLIH